MSEERPLDLSVVIPCFNEMGHLETGLAELEKVLDCSRLDYEIVCVDDGSTDGTRDALEAYRAAHPRVRVILHDRNRGRGAAFKTGFRQGRGRVSGFIDIDLEIHPVNIIALYNLIARDGFHVATGLRYYSLTQTRTLVRHVLSVAYRNLTRFALRFDIQDSETGCKFFDREAGAGVVLGSEADGWFWDTEVMARAVLKDLRIREMPVLFLKKPEKKSSVRLFRDIRRYLKDLREFRPKVGLSYSEKSPIYWNPAIYDAALNAVQGDRYMQTFADVAALIPDGASVVDVCAGACHLYRDFLRGRKVTYTGYDFNGHMVMNLRRDGVPVRFIDLLAEPVPPADYVVMCSSFMYFNQRREETFAKLKAAARRAVIISEPVNNLSKHRFKLIGRIANRFTSAGRGDHGFRYDLEGFRAFATEHGASEFVYTPGRQNAIAVFRN